MKRSDFEIMAPVGSRESLAAALNAGADAVYFGIEGLNMRSRSSANFTADDMAEIARICDEKGVKTYLTVNTVIYDSDTDLMRRIIDRAHEAGISAIIASDMAAILYARSIGQEVHISTQVNVSNFEAVKFYSQFADVMVLARELNMEQVAEIHRRIEESGLRGPVGRPIRLEMFCHGALCMAVSGKCYLSLHQLNSSANRGACNQICRRSYTVTDRETGDQLNVENKYIMSPKDLKTIHFLNKMVDAGVSVFKIEGRARGPEYVAETVGCYSEALEAICAGDFCDEMVEKWDERLSKVFNRGFWNGYYLGQRLGEWSSKYGSSSTRVKKYAAKAIRHFSKLGVGEFLMEAGELKIGDEIVISGPTTGALIMKIEELRFDLKPVEKVTKGQLFSMPVPDKVRPSDRLYLWDEKDPSNRQTVEPSSPFMQVVYLHGLSSSGQSTTAQRLRRTLSKYEVISPDIPVQPEVAMTELKRLASTLRPDAVIVGTSMGGMFAQMFRGFRRILINPSFHPSRHLREKIGLRMPFHNPRLDGLKDFEVTEKLVKKYEKLESKQFDPKFGVIGKNKDSKDQVHAFFGTQDNVVNCKEEYLEHYADAIDFEGGHRLDPNSTITLVVPLIQSL